MAVTRTQMNAVRAALEEKLALSPGAVPGVEMRVGRGKYGASEVWIKIMVREVGEDGFAINKEREAWLERQKYGASGVTDGEGNDLSWSVLDQRFRFPGSGKTYRIDGFRSRAPKRPIRTVCDQDGKIYDWSIHTVALLLASNPVEAGDA